MSRKQKTVNRTHHRRCSFEALENRRLLAGIVTVTQVGSKATVVGDGDANAILITSAGVTGIAGSSTTIIGGAFTGALTSLKVDMKGGNDTVTLGEKPVPPGVGLTVNGKTTIKLGSGNDTLLYQNTNVSGKLQIHKGTGRDTIRTGTGNTIAKIKPNPLGSATITGAATVPEGGTYTLNLFTQLKNRKDVVTQWDIDWDGDGTTDQTVFGNPTTATHKYPVAGDFIITATATIAKKGNKKDTFKLDADLNITVENVAPSAITLNSPGSINENGTLLLTGSFVDPGVTQGHRITVQWDDPNDTADSVFEIGSVGTAASPGDAQAGSPYSSTTAGDLTTLTVTSVNFATGQVNFTVSHQYLDDGDANVGNGTTSDNAHIVVTVEDFVGPDPVDFTLSPLSSNSNSKDVTVNNIVPSITVNPIASIVEAGTATVAGSFTDIGLLDDHTVTINWGDGTQSVFAVPAALTPLNAGGISQNSGVAATLTIGAGVNNNTGFVPFSATHVYANNGLFTVQVIVADDDGGSNNGSSTFNVTNAIPVVAALAATPNPVVENGTATLTGNFTDVGVSDSHTVTVNWADPNNPINSVFSLGATNTLSNGQTFNSTSGDGAVLTLTAPPTAGGLVVFSIATHLYRDDGIAPGNGTISDISNITVNVTDSDAGNGNAGTNLTVNNVAPTVPAPTVPAPVITEGNTTTVSGSLTDPGLLDTHSITVNWGDATTNSTFTLGATNALSVGQTFPSTSGDGAVLTINSVAAGTVGFTVASHKYVEVIAANITVTVNDDDGGSNNNSVAITVNNFVPVVLVNPPAAVSEGGTATVSGSFTDAGLADTHIVTVNWADPNNATNSVFNLGATNTLVAGQTFGSTTGDGAILTVTSVALGTGQVGYSVNGHKYTDDGPANAAAGANGTPSDIIATLTVTVQDNHGGSGNGVVPITINDVAPVLSVNGLTVTETADAAANPANLVTTVTGSFTDPGLSDRHVLTVTWADPNPTLQTPNVSSFIIQGIQTPAGVAVLATGDIVSSTAGDSAVLTITSITPGTGLVQFSIKHRYVDDGLSNTSPPGLNNTPSDASLVSATITDDDTLFNNQNTTVTVNNALPSIALTTVATAAFATFKMNGSFTDVGLNDVHTIVINWDDATTSTFQIGGTTLFIPGVSTFAQTAGDPSTLKINTVNLGTGVVTFDVTHTYANGNPRNLQAQISDDDGSGFISSATVAVDPV